MVSADANNTKGHDIHSPSLARPPPTLPLSFAQCLRLKETSAAQSVAASRPLGRSGWLCPSPFPQLRTEAAAVASSSGRPRGQKTTGPNAAGNAVAGNYGGAATSR